VWSKESLLLTEDPRESEVEGSIEEWLQRKWRNR